MSINYIRILKVLKNKLGIKLKLVQTDNGLEFGHDTDKTNKKSEFEKTLEKMEKNIKGRYHISHGKMG